MSDAERQVVIDDLREHTADGRLTLDEFEERVDEALRARTGRDLRLVTRELPALRPAPTARQWRWPDLAIPPQLLVAAAIVVVALAAGVWWALIPLWFMFGHRLRTHAHHGTRARAIDDGEAATYV